MIPPRSHANCKPQPDISQFAEICIDASVQSTIVFDSIIIQKLLIVTKISGTAYGWVFPAPQIEFD